MRFILSLHFEEIDIFIVMFEVSNFQRILLHHFLDEANCGRTKNQLKESKCTAMKIRYQCLFFVILAIMLLIYLFFHDHFLYKFILAILTPAYTI